MRLFAPVTLLSCCVALSSPLFAQYTVGKVRFDGAMPYAQADLQAASGLKPGDPLSTPKLQETAQHLIDTGAFGDLQASLDGPFKSITVVFKVKPADQLLHTAFENFVWWTPEELASELHGRVPLFNGNLPEAGSLGATVAQTLTSMLAEKGVHAEIAHVTLDPGPSRPTASIAYRIESPAIRLASFDVQNLSPEFTPAVSKALAGRINRPYAEGDADGSAPGAVLNIYRDAGYLDVALDHFTRTLDSSKPSAIEVKLAASVNPGEPYHVTALDWPGSPLVSPADFSKVARLHPGDVASRQALNATVEAVQNAYKQHGFIDAGIEVTPVVDKISHGVAYKLAPRPGDPYRFDSVQVNGLPADAKRQFDSAWKLQPGSAYDGTYLNSFLKQNIAQPYLKDYTIKYRVETHPESHLVQVVFDCSNSQHGRSSGQ